MKVIPIKGTIVSNNDSWIYDWFGWDYTAPKNVALPETGEEQSASAALLGAALGMVGLAGLAKRKKRED